MILGVGYGRLRRYDDAIACYRKAIELSRTTVLPMAISASALSKKGLHDEAIASLPSKAVELAPQDDSLATTAWLAFWPTSPDAKLRDPDEAVKLAKRAVELSPNDRTNTGTRWARPNIAPATGAGPLRH